MENRFGKLALPLSALAGAALLGGAGMLAIGPIGGAIGAATGALLGGVLFFAG